MRKKMYGSFLFARPSFFEGIARIMDFGGSLNQYNSFPNGGEADFAAISYDWAMIGQDFATVLPQDFEEKTKV